MVDDLEIYKILLQRHFNDDRLMGERSSIFIASSSILFAGFAILQPTTGILRIILCCLGIILSIISFCYQQLMRFADKITPDHIGRNNAAIYFLVATKRSDNDS